MTRFRLVSLTIALLFGISLLPAPNVALADSPTYVFRRSWGGEAYIFDAADIAVSSQKVLYVLSHSLNRVTRIDPNDQTYTLWGQRGVENGEFWEPYGITVDDAGNVYVADTSNCRIQKFNPFGGFILKFGSCGYNPGQFSMPRDIAVDRFGYIYVLDNFYVHKFGNDGSFIKRWGEMGSATEQFNSPRGIALDSLSNVYVADTNNHRVQKFDNDGNYILAWGNQGNGNGEFYLPMGIAVDSSNYVYVSDGDYRLQKFTSDGFFIKEWDVNPYVYQQYTGKIYITGDDLYVATGNQVVRYTLGGEYTNQWNADHDGGDSYWPNPYWGIAIDQSGDIWTTEDFWLMKYSPFGTILGGIPPCYQVCFNYPRGIKLDSNGNIYIVNTNSDEVLKYIYATGQIIKWGSEGTGNGQLEYPSGIAIDNVHNYLYVADANNNRIQKFNLQGVYVSQWGSFGKGNGQFDHPNDLVLGMDGYVYVLDSNNHRVQIFEGSGIYIGQWGSVGVGNGQFENPEGLAVDSHNDFFVSDSLRNDIQKFTATGIFLTKWGSYGTSPTQFLEPTGLAVGNDGLVYVMDTGNHRVQVFGENYPELDPTSGLIQNGSFEATPVLVEWTYSLGSIPVSQSTYALQGTHSLLLGQPVSRAEQGEGQAWAHTTFYVPADWSRPMLSFRYNMFANDILDYSDFFVEIQDGVGHNHLATVLRDGYQPCSPGVAPTAGTDLGWRSVTYDLSAFKGQHVRLVFSNRNLWPASWGIWSYVDDVRVLDAGPLPAPVGTERVYLPVLSNKQCDPIPAGASLDGSNMVRPTTP